MQPELPIRNRLLTQLSPSDLERLGPLTRVTLELRQPLESPDVESEFVYFLEDGIASVVFEVSAKGATEIGLIGSEGMTGLTSVYRDDRTPFAIFVQVEGSAMRCQTGYFRRALAERAEMQALMLKYARAFSIQVSATAVANGRAKLEERLARWLLMVSDRVGDTFHITHEFIAIMLAVRRSGVTLAIQNLEGRGLVQATRGTVRIVDRQGLVEAAQGSYGLAEREYQRLLGSGP